MIFTESAIVCLSSTTTYGRTTAPRIGVSEHGTGPTPDTGIGAALYAALQGSKAHREQQFA